MIIIDLIKKKQKDNILVYYKLLTWRLDESTQLHPQTL